MPQENVSSIFNDRYELIRLIGKGAMGLVYLAYDSHLDREVAIKVLSTSVAKNVDVLQRFEQEVRITARLQHSGVVAVFESGESHEGMPCYAMALALGQTLEEYLDDLRNKPDAWEESSLIDRLSLFVKLLEVMNYAHSEHIVHRDLKPANIIMGSFGEVRIIDWGLGRILEEDDVADNFDELFGADAPAASDGSAETSKVNRPSVGARSSSHGRKNRTDSHIANPQLQGGADAKFAATLVPGTFVADVADVVETGSVTSPDDDQADTATGYNSHQAIHETNETTLNERETVAETNRHVSRNVPDYTGVHAANQGREKKRSGSGSDDVFAPNTDTHSSTETDSQHAIETSRNHKRHISSHPYSSRLRRAVSVESNHPERNTRFGEILGSPVYMSPEQARGEADRADQRTDVYSLGAILFELLTLKTPQTMVENENIAHFINRIVDGTGKRRLQDEWQQASPALCEISKKSLRRRADQRYRNCAEFMADIHALLKELSASYSELERQRLEKERQGAWIPVGNWDYTLKGKRLKPFTEMVVAYEGEAVGQMLNADQGGLVIGGCGLQMYPCAVNIGDDIRMRMEFSVIHGSEIWIFLRGAPPTPCYTFRIGSHDGRWLTVSRMNNVDDMFRPEMLTMHALSEDEASALFSRTQSRRKRQLDIEIVGSTLRIVVDGQDPLIVQDPCPLVGPMHQQLAIGTLGTQMVIHTLSIDQRRSPLMLPSYEVANELLRQNLYPQAITYYQKFLDEQIESEERIEAHFMLCLAFQRAGHLKQAEQELHSFLLDNMEHRLSRDAIFELARLRTDNDYRRIDLGVRVVLSYQEADDRVRSRFCLWASNLLHDTIALNGIEMLVIDALRLMKHLIHGFADEAVLLETISSLVSKSVMSFVAQLIDLQAHDQIKECYEYVQKGIALGYDIQSDFPYGAHEYLSTSRRIMALLNETPFGTTPDDATIDQICELYEPYHTVRDIISLTAVGCAETLVLCFERKKSTDSMTLLCLAALYARIGEDDKSDALLDTCFRLMDAIEDERTNIHATTIMRLGMYGLEFLPWHVVWELVSQMVHEPELQVVATWLAECLGRHSDALAGYEHLRAQNVAGYRTIIEQSLTRLQLLMDAE